MTLQARVTQILNDPRFPDDPNDDEHLIGEYGADNKPEAIYQLVDQYGWAQVYDLLVSILRDESQSQHWGIAQIVLFYASSDHKHGRRQCPMPADSTIALLYHRFPDGIDDGDRIWAIVCDLKGVDHWSQYDPLKDSEVCRELETLRSA
jgi:hypothetical protein